MVNTAHIYTDEHSKRVYNNMYQNLRQNEVVLQAIYNHGFVGHDTEVKQYMC
jgi:hypothetical protein